MHRLVSLPLATSSWYAQLDYSAITESHEALFPHLRYNETAGLLTKRGQLQLSQLGARLRSIYIDMLAFLPTTHNSSLLVSRSTATSYQSRGWLSLGAR